MDNYDNCKCTDCAMRRLALEVERIAYDSDLKVEDIVGWINRALEKEKAVEVWKEEGHEPIL